MKKIMKRYVSRGEGSLSGGPSPGSHGGGVHVKVILRCRPLTQFEKRGDSILDCREESREVVIKQNKRSESFDKTFCFDGVCGPSATQAELFDNHIVPLVDEVLQGFNCTIFAYGQTGTGKTYTMEGEWTKNLTSEPPTPNSASTTPRSPDLPPGVGVIPRSIASIFQRLMTSKAEFSIKVSYLEIYNEELHDLLGERQQQLRIYEGCGATKGLAVDKLEEITVSTLPEVYAIIMTAVKRRRTAETLLNRQSSRSHSIFTITITQKEINLDGEDIIRIGKLNLVDLAGSENIQRSGTSHIKDRTKEAGMINQSLLTLGRVINALVEHATYIPYRDSKLTRLLQDSLGGRTKTCIIATVSPSALSADETVSTLDYAHRAKHIRNRPEVNQRMTQKFVLKELQQEIDKLKQELSWARDKSGAVYLSNERFAELESLMAAQESSISRQNDQIIVLSDQNREKDVEIASNRSLRVAMEVAMANINEDLAVTRAKLEEARESELISTRLHVIAVLIAFLRTKKLAASNHILANLRNVVCDYETAFKELVTWINRRDIEIRSKEETLTSVLRNEIGTKIFGSLGSNAENIQSKIDSTVELNEVAKKSLLESVEREFAQLESNTSANLIPMVEERVSSMIHNVCRDLLTYVDEASAQLGFLEDNDWTDFHQRTVVELVLEEINRIKSSVNENMKKLEENMNLLPRATANIDELEKGLFRFADHLENSRVENFLKADKASQELHDVMGRMECRVSEFSEIRTSKGVEVRSKLLDAAKAFTGAIEQLNDVQIREEKEMFEHFLSESRLARDKASNCTNKFSKCLTDVCPVHELQIYVDSEKTLMTTIKDDLKIVHCTAKRVVEYGNRAIAELMESQKRIVNDLSKRQSNQVNNINSMTESIAARGAEVGGQMRLVVQSIGNLMEEYKFVTTEKIRRVTNLLEKNIGEQSSNLKSLKSEAITFRNEIRENINSASKSIRDLLDHKVPYNKKSREDYLNGVEFPECSEEVSVVSEMALAESLFDAYCSGSTEPERLCGEELSSHIQNLIAQGRIGPDKLKMLTAIVGNKLTMQASTLDQKYFNAATTIKREISKMISDITAKSSPTSKFTETIENFTETIENFNQIN